MPDLDEIIARVEAKASEFDRLAKIYRMMNASTGKPLYVETAALLREVAAFLRAHKGQRT